MRLYQNFHLNAATFLRAHIVLMQEAPGQDFSKTKCCVLKDLWNLDSQVLSVEFFLVTSSILS